LGGGKGKRSTKETKARGGAIDKVGQSKKQPLPRVAKNK